MSTIETTNKAAEGRSDSNAGLGAILDDGPDFEDGHDCEGFRGGCLRMGCPGGTNCTELTPNVK